MTLTGIESHTIQTYHTDRFGLASPSTFASFFEEAAANNAALHGFPGEALYEQGIAWVLSRLSFTVDRYPSVGETITVKTWPSSHTSTVALRCFEVFDEAEHLIAEGTTGWLVIDIARRKMMPVPSFVTEHYPEGNPPCKEFPTRVVPRLRSPKHTMVFTSRKADIDIMGHVNNVRYISWIHESVPEKFLAAHEPVLIDISYRHECDSVTTLGSQTGYTEDGDTLHSIVHTETGRELCRARTEWRKRRTVSGPYGTGTTRNSDE